MTTSVTRPAGLRFTVSGNILGVPLPRSPFRVFNVEVGKLSHKMQRAQVLTRYFQKTALNPAPVSVNTLSHLGKHPHSKVCVWDLTGYNSPDARSPQVVVVKLPTIESTYATHTAKCIQGWTHPDMAALRVACEVLQGTESYLWVSKLRLLILVDLSAASSDTSAALVLHMVLTLGSTLRQASYHLISTR